MLESSRQSRKYRYTDTYNYIYISLYIYIYIDTNCMRRIKKWYTIVYMLRNATNVVWFSFFWKCKGIHYWNLGGGITPLQTMGVFCWFHRGPTWFHRHRSNLCCGPGAGGDDDSFTLAADGDSCCSSNCTLSGREKDVKKEWQERGVSWWITVTSCDEFSSKTLRIVEGSFPEWAQFRMSRLVKYRIHPDWCWVSLWKLGHLKFHWFTIKMNVNTTPGWVWDAPVFYPRRPSVFSQSQLISLPSSSWFDGNGLPTCKGDGLGPEIWNI